MKKWKIKSSYKPEDIGVMYQAAILHANLNNDFGLFCLGIAVSLRSIFADFQGSDPCEQVNIDLMKAVAGTITALDGFDGAVVDLRTAEVNEMTNKELSEKVLGLAEDARKKRDKKH